LNKRLSQHHEVDEALARVIRTGLMAFVLAIYVAFAFFPFQWDPPRRVTNHAQWLAGGGIRFAGAGIARTKTAPGWLADAIRGNRLNITLRIRPFSTHQDGPARIMTLCRNPDHCNFTIAQAGRDLNLRLRAPWTDAKGLPPVRVLDVFRESVWTDIQINIRPHRLQIAVNGIVRIHERLPAKPFAGWNPAYRLALGNALTLNRPWLGEIRRAIVSVGQKRVNYALRGTLHVPSTYWYFHRMPILAPSLQMRPRGIVLNIGGFIPLGILFGLWARERGRRRYWIALGLIALFSASLESLQLCFAHRYPSINDFILNTLGGGIGIVFVHWLPRILALTRRILRQQ
jgi:VanZ family protein